MSALHFHCFKKQAKISPQTNIIHDLSWRFFSKTWEGLQVPASLLSEQTVLINICSSVLTLCEGQQLLLGVISYSFPYILVVLICSFEYTEVQWMYI